MTHASHKCDVCGFWLWQPIGATPKAFVGLYDDDRFPGRCLVVWHDHVEHLDDLDPQDLLAFMGIIQSVSRALKAVTGTARINVAVLGNQEPHLHAHVIPRGGVGDLVPTASPWTHPRPAQPLQDNTRRDLIAHLARALEANVVGWTSPAP